MMRTISFEQIHLDAAAGRPKAQTASREVFSDLFEKVYEQANRSERRSERQAASIAERRQDGRERAESAAGAQADSLSQDMMDNESWSSEVEATSSQTAGDQELQTIEQPDSAESDGPDESGDVGAEPQTDASAAQPEAAGPLNDQAQSGPAADSVGQAIHSGVNVRAVGDPTRAAQTAGSDDPRQQAGQVQVKPMAAKQSPTADAAILMDATGQSAKAKTTPAKPDAAAVPAGPTTDGDGEPADSTMTKAGSVRSSEASKSISAAALMDRSDTDRIAASTVETTGKTVSPVVSASGVQAPLIEQIQSNAEDLSKRQDRTPATMEKGGVAGRPSAAAETAAIRPAAESQGASVSSEQRGRSEISWAVSPARSPEAAKGLDVKTLGDVSLPKSASPDADRMQENVDRVVRTARAGIRLGSSRMQIRLEPPELGSLRIEIRQNADGLTMQLQASNAKAQHLLQQNAHELRAALDAQGLQPRQIEIQLRTDLQEDASHPHANQDHAGSFSRSDSHGQPQTGGQDPSNANSFESFRSAESESADAAGAADAEAVEPNPSPRWQALEFNAVDLVA